MSHNNVDYFSTNRSSLLKIILWDFTTFRYILVILLKKRKGSLTGYRKFWSCNFLSSGKRNLQLRQVSKLLFYPKYSWVRVHRLSAHCKHLLAVNTCLKVGAEETWCKPYVIIRPGQRISSSLMSLSEKRRITKPQKHRY